MEVYQELAIEVLEALGSPRALTCKLLLQAGDIGQLSDLKLNPRDYIDPIAFKIDAQATGLFKKLELPGDTSQLTGEAMNLWLEDEKLCKSTNDRILYYRSLAEYPLADDHSSDRAAVLLLNTVRKKVKSVLGRQPPKDITGRFGPGATYQLHSQQSSILHKLTTVPEATERCHEQLSSLRESAWFRYHAGDHFFNDNLTDGTFDSPVVRGNRWSSVPKTATRRRSIAIEPCLNLYIQLGIGADIRKRLQRRGLLLQPLVDRPLGHDGWLRKTGTDSKTIHMSWAREASVSNDYATLDLSSASDTVCKELVRYVLPEAWYELLTSCRSPTTLIGGCIFHLEKFSSMGNGYTFELETLLFWAICESCLELTGESGGCTVFGDDIIVPTDAARTVKAALRMLGFRLNTTKSFDSGPFRESCGGDYFNGVDVRPVQVTEVPHDPPSWVVFHNLMTRIHQWCPIPGVLNRVRGQVPTKVRKCGGGEELGDIVLHGVPPKKRWIEKTQSWQIRAIVPVTSKIRIDRVDEDAQIVAALFGLPSTGCPTRGNSGYRIRWVG